jgi:hypothetical protein
MPDILLSAAYGYIVAGTQHIVMDVLGFDDVATLEALGAVVDNHGNLFVQSSSGSGGRVTLISTRTVQRVLRCLLPWRLASARHLPM